MTNKLNYIPAWSRVMIDIVEEKLSSIIEVIQTTNKEPLLKATIIDFGDQAGWNNNRQVHELKKGMTIYVYAQSVLKYKMPNGDTVNMVPDDKIFCFVEA